MLVKKRYMYLHYPQYTANKISAASNIWQVVCLKREYVILADFGYPV
jgi:hypothetical protein